METKREKVNRIKKWIIGLNVVMVVIVLTACGNAANNGNDFDDPASYQKITAEEAKERMLENPDALIVDVRTSEEYEESHIEGALLIPNENIESEKPESLPDEEAEILVYCRSGNRSAQAAEKLVAMGYTNVKDFGGIRDWPYDTVTGDGSGDGRFGDDERSDKMDAPDEEDVSSLANFNAVDLEGNAVDETIFQDHELTMVNAWATFCGYCLKEMPDLAELNDEFAEDDFQIVGIVMDVFNRDGTYSDGQVELAKEAVAKTGADYRQMMPSAELALGQLSDINSFPTTFFVDKEGNIISDYYLGAKGKSQWKQLIEEQLKEIKN